MFWESGFRLRGFISLLVTFSGLIMIASGIIGFIMPEGRIAYWTDWRFWGLGKEQWGTIHTILGFVFVFASCFHLFFNWRALLAYLRDKVKQTYRLRSELVLVLLITILCTHGSIAGVPPFTTIMDLGSSIKKTWYAGQDVHPPFPHAELMTLKQLAGKLELNLDGVLAYLQELGFADVQAGSTLKQLAQRSNASPAQIFQAMMMDDRLYQ
jgi:hypothetical protein